MPDHHYSWTYKCMVQQTYSPKTFQLIPKFLRQRSNSFRVQTCTFQSEMVKYCSQFKNSTNWLLSFSLSFLKAEPGFFSAVTCSQIYFPWAVRKHQIAWSAWRILKSFQKHKDICFGHYGFITTIINKYKTNQSLIFKPKPNGALKMVSRIAII